MKDEIYGFLGLVLIIFCIAVIFVNLRATFFCRQRGFNWWNVQGCYNESKVYEK